jgi:hypothetical protein
VLLPEIERQQKLGKDVIFRADAAFAKPEVYEVLEERVLMYVIRIPANDSLERDIAELLTRPAGRPSHKPIVWYKDFLYQAASWKTARRVRIEKWSLTSLQQRLVKTVGRLIKHARYYWLLLAESHLTRRLFAAMVRRIDALPLPTG